MKQKIKEESYSCNAHYSCGNSNCGEAVYGLGFLGTAIYYISIATGFWVGVLGVLKALVCWIWVV